MRIQGNGEDLRTGVLANLMARSMSASGLITISVERVPLVLILRKSDSGRKLRKLQKEHLLVLGVLLPLAETMCSDSEAHNIGPTRARDHHPGGEIVRIQGRLHHEGIGGENDPTHTLDRHLHGVIDIETRHPDGNEVHLPTKIGMAATRGGELTLHKILIVAKRWYP